MSFITTKKARRKKTQTEIAFNMVFPSSNGTVKEENPLHIELVSFLPLCASFYFPSSLSLYKSAPFHFLFLTFSTTVCLSVCLHLPSSLFLSPSLPAVCLSLRLSFALSVCSLRLYLTYFRFVCPSVFIITLRYCCKPPTPLKNRKDKTDGLYA